MALIKYKLGDLIELSVIKNKDELYTEDDAIGVNIDKIILPMRGSNESKDFKNFFLVPPKHFAYNPRGSRKLGLGFNDTNKTYIITFNDVVFKIKDSAKNIISDTYLFMYLSRKEWDRRAEFISWGSSTEVFDWNVFCEEIIELPDLCVQQKYVDIYKGIVENQASYETGLEDLKLFCDGYIEELRRKFICEKIGSYIEEVTTKNESEIYALQSIRGISIEKEFIDTKADLDGVSAKNYKIVNSGCFAFNPNTARMGEKICVALNSSSEVYLVSSIYPVFKIKDQTKLIPEYLMMWLKRDEFDRYARFNSWGSARETFNFCDMMNVQIPIPSLEIQKAIVDIYNAYMTRKEINEQLKQQIKIICPVLIKGAVEEAKRSQEV